MDLCVNVKGGKEFKKYFTLGIVSHFRWSKTRMETIQRHFSSAIIHADRGRTPYEFIKVMREQKYAGKGA